MKTRVTFRVNHELAEALRELPNQTQFVEDALRQALGRTCPMCEGSGRIPRSSLKVSNLRRAELAPLDRSTALQLKRLVGVGHELAASHLDVRPGARADEVGFTLRRGRHVLLDGSLRRGAEKVQVH
ncbi:MAG TPA: hypothetical protein VM686_38070 [Polyangiaceae bacterium]|nr:hypothetical protein [Polyangiaceae bacterium]